MSATLAKAASLTIDQTLLTCVGIPAKPQSHSITTHQESTFAIANQCCPLSQGIPGLVRQKLPKGI